MYQPLTSVAQTLTDALAALDSRTAQAGPDDYAHGGTLRARIARRRAERTASAPRICPGCGIDLPTRWHWDGCPRG